MVGIGFHAVNSIKGGAEMNFIQKYFFDLVYGFEQRVIHSGIAPKLILLAMFAGTVAFIYGILKTQFSVILKILMVLWALLWWCIILTY
jgi:hypothetical protein